MDIEIRKLSPELTDDFMSAFDNPAFFSNPDLSFGCYCTWYYWTDEMENERNRGDDEARKCFKRNLAVKLISENKLTGFLAYANGLVVGWCNAGMKQNYNRLCRETQWWMNTGNNEKVLSVVCYVVHPDMQRKGIATALLKAVCDDAQRNGYEYVESYPGVNDDGSPNYKGNCSMYVKQGFEIFKNDFGNTIARKKL